MSEAWVTLATNDQYAIGALVLAESLKRVGTTKQLHILITKQVTQPVRDVLGKFYHGVSEVDLLDSKDEANLALIKRPELGVTFTKLHCWTLTQYTKAVFLDADALVLQNADDLFGYPELSAAPDVGWPDCFNSGLFVFVPSRETYHALVQFGVSHGSFDGGDQGLLNSYFHDWNQKGPSHRLPFLYNMSSNIVYNNYAAAFKHFAQQVKIVHFLGAVKPWHHHYDANTRRLSFRQDSHSDAEHVEFWWRLFVESVMPFLTPETAIMSSNINLTEASSMDSEEAADESSNRTKILFKAIDETINDLEAEFETNITRCLIKHVRQHSGPLKILAADIAKEWRSMAQESINNIVAENDVKSSLFKLDEITTRQKKNGNARDRTEAWRPTGHPSTDLSAHFIREKLEYRDKLKKLDLSDQQILEKQRLVEKGRQEVLDAAKEMSILWKEIRQKVETIKSKNNGQLKPIKEAAILEEIKKLAKEE